MVNLLSGNDRSVGHHREMDPWVGDKVGLELSQVHIEGSVESQGRSDGGDNLTNETVQIGVSGMVNVKVAATDVIDGIIIHDEGTVGLLQGGVGGLDRGVGIHYSSGHLRSGVDAFLIVHGQPLHEQGGEAGASASSEGVEDEEALKTSALVSKFPDAVQDKVHNLLSNGVVATSVVVGCILFACD